MSRSFHIAICGAGPAGLSAALALHRLGHRISLYDQFDAARPLGSGLILQPAGLAVLDQLGLGRRIRGLGARIDRLHGQACGSGRTVLDVRYEALGADRGYAVHRAALFNVLYDALAAHGVTVNHNHRVTGLVGRHVLFGNLREGPFDVIVDALGSRSPLIAHASGPDVRQRLGYGALWASLPWPGAPFDRHALEQRYRKASVMIGVLPIGRLREGQPEQAAFFWSLKTRDYGHWQNEGLERWKERVRQLWPDTADLLNTITTPGQMVLASYDHHTLTLPFGPNLVFIGDSAHATSPQLGQGANMALLDAAALTEAIASEPTLQAAIENYAQKRRFHVKLYQALSLVFTPFYQSDSLLLPVIRDGAAAQFSRLPLAQRLLARIVSGKLGLRL